MSFKENKKKLSRVGEIKTAHGKITTPCFMPIATKGAVKNLTPDELKLLGAELILGNTYHLWLRPGLKVFKKIGDLHKFMNWPGPILTDSGGYQIFSLGNHKFKNRKLFNKSFVKITENGAKFRDPIDGKDYLLTPEKSIEIQLTLGSDIIMVLDECPPYPCTHQEARKAVDRTTRWAKRSKDYFTKYTLEHKKRPLLFCIVQGSIYKDLRQRSIKELLVLGDWDGYAIGGVAVGEPRQYLPKILKWTLPLLPKDKPRYLMGLGKPEEIVTAVKNGIDLFDCVIPTREARHGRLYLWSGEQSTSKNFYKTINITNSKFKFDSSSINQTNLKNYSKAYLHHLFKMNEPLGMKLATMQNLGFYLELIENLKKNS